MKHIKALGMALALMVGLFNVPWLGAIDALADSTRYTFPAEEAQVESKYVRVNIDNLDACLYAFLNEKCEVEYRVLAEDNEKPNDSALLLPATIQDAIIFDEGQPNILITVHTQESGSNPSFCTKLSETMTQNVKDGQLTIETIVGPITFDVSELSMEATPTPSQASKTSASKTTANPQQNTPKPTPVPTPTPEQPKEPWMLCPYCNKPMYSYEEYLAHYNAAHKEEQKTPEPTPKGHYERRWVVDKPAVTHSEWVCNCGARFTSEPAHDAHCKAHALAGENTRYWVETIVDQEEQGHWEEAWVPDP